MSIKEAARHRILDDMVSKVQSVSKWKVMIVDNSTLRIISACVKMSEIMEKGITLVEKIEIPREPVPSMDAVYFITPNSIDKLIEDFSDADSPQYGHAHLYFTSRVPEEEFNKIKLSPIKSRLKAFVELNLDFIAFESNVFHFDLKNSLFNLYSPESKESAIEQSKIASKITSLCATLGEYPIIRYYGGKDGKSEGTNLSQSIASKVQERLDALMRGSQEYADSARISKDRATLLILDRGFDVLSPLLHEFSYQAMIYDVLEISDMDHWKFDTVTNSGENKTKEVIIGESDPLWVNLRHKHMAEVINYVLSEYNAFLKENKATKLYSGKKVDSLKEMADAMRSMPQYQEMLSKYSLHINLNNSCMAAYTANSLAALAALEQDMATGASPTGEEIKTQAIISSLPPLLTDPLISLSDKIRLLMIYIVSQEGIADKDRSKLIDVAKIPVEEQTALVNLKYLGVNLLKGIDKKKNKKEKKEKQKQRDDAPPYDLSRYVPPLRGIIEGLIEGNLSSEKYPYQKESSASVGKGEADSTSGVSARKSGQPRWASDKSKRKETGSSSSALPNGPRFIVYIAGGCTFSEMRTIYEVAAATKKDVLLGTTSPLSPKQFVEGLKSIQKVQVI